MLSILCVLAYSAPDKSKPYWNVTVKKAAVTEDIDPEQFGINRVRYSDIVIPTPPIGYNITIDGRILHAPAIKERYLCQRGTSWVFTPRQTYIYSEDVDAAGVIVVLIISLLMCAASTGIWPLLLRIRSMTSEIIGRLTVIEGNQAAQMEKEGLKAERSESKTYTNFDLIWLGFSFVCLFVVSTMTAQNLCQSLGIKNMIKRENISKCVDLYNTDLNSKPSKSRHTLEDQWNLRDRKQASYDIDKSGVVKFYSPCGQAYTYTKDGTLWLLAPYIDKVCDPVNATIITKQSSWMQKKCSGGRWQDIGKKLEPSGKTNVVTVWSGANISRQSIPPTVLQAIPWIGVFVERLANIFYRATIERDEWRYCVGCCGFLKWGNLWHKGELRVGYETEDGWESCHWQANEHTSDYTNEGTLKLIRIATNGTRSDVPVWDVTVQNSRESWKNWYTNNRGKVVVASDEFDMGRGTNLYFGQLADANMIKTLQLQYIIPSDHMPYWGSGMRRVNWASDLWVCRQTFTLASEVANHFQEFQPPCKKATIEKTDEGAYQIQASGEITGGAENCVVKLAFSEDLKVVQTVTLNRNNALKIGNIYGWNCDSKEVGVGTECYQKNMSRFKFNTISATTNYTVDNIYHSKDDDEPEVGGDIGITTPEISADVKLGTSFKDILLIIGYVIAGIAVVGIIAAIIIMSIKCYSNKKTVETIKTVALKDL